MAARVLNQKQREAFDIALERHNLYIGGSAGTGKTFLLTQIVTELRSQGKNVNLTCTTGIACAAYHPSLHATTVHRFCGIEDGRYSTEELISLISHNPKCKQTLSRIKGTDVLIVDEISMLSAKLFGQLAEVCSLKDNNRLFGGIQVILCGDFFQLPPVPNSLYGDEGEFCFTDETFQRTITHKVFLTDVIRQSEIPLISAIAEISKGCPSQQTCDLMNNLQRPLRDQPTIKLFSTNHQVDEFNRRMILSSAGDITEYRATDTGEERLLNRILAMKCLWLKPGCPVMLLRNMTDRLCNGLVGRVTSLHQDGPIVNFPTVDIETKIPMMSFSVFNPKEQRNVANREQIPLKLAYAITIHKAQGMTLERVEVDCRGVFKPGQIAVAVGRAKNTKGLRVINFSPSLCIPPPSSIQDWIDQPSTPISKDLSCCNHKRTPTEPTGHFSIGDMREIEEMFDHFVEDDDGGDDDDDETEFDDAFNALISSNLFQIDQETHDDITLPPNFDASQILEGLVTDDPITPIQKETNDVLKALTSSSSGLHRVQQFCKREFLALSEIVETHIPPDCTFPVKPESLVDIYTKFHQHQVSEEYLLNCLILFEETPKFTEAQAHISYGIVVTIRKFLLQQKVDLLPMGKNVTTQRQATTSCQATVRYVAGYCISKTRFKFLKKKTSLQMKTSVSDQIQMEECSMIVEIMDSLRMNEVMLQMTTNLPETLVTVARRQNLTRGLTNISDDLFHFFMQLAESCLKCMNDEVIHKHGSSIFDHSMDIILRDQELKEKFLWIVGKYCTTKELLEETEEEVTGLLRQAILKVSVIDIIYQEVTRKFVMVMLNQYRRDLLQALSVEKTLAHRKQILLRKKKTGSTSAGTITFSDIIKDSSAGKQTSHDIMKGLLLNKANFLNTFTKGQLLALSHAYMLKIGKKTAKCDVLKAVCSAITTTEGMENAKAFDQQLQLSQSTIISEHQSDTTVPVASSDPVTSSDPVASTSTECHVDSTVLEPAFSSSDVDSETDVKCKVCDKIGKAKCWIQCDDCNLWLHRKCAGLQSKAKWQTAMKEGRKFYCPDCQIKH